MNGYDENRVSDHNRALWKEQHWISNKKTCPGLNLGGNINIITS